MIGSHNMNLYGDGTVFRGERSADSEVPTVDINELRQSLGAVQPEEVSELLDRLEAAEKERDSLRAKIEAMENQEPFGWFARIDGDGPLMECKHADISRVPLYALPGAQPALIVPDGWQLVTIEPTALMKTAGINIEVYPNSAHSSDCLTWEEVKAIYIAMLAAAPNERSESPETKP